MMLATAPKKKINTLALLFTIPYSKVVYSSFFGILKGGAHMEDKTLVCKDCGKRFVFTVREQQFYKEKGFDNDPIRCAECRKIRKQQKNNFGGNGGNKKY
jgi:hypothetical protein